jgi:hypothetical protein
VAGIQLYFVHEHSSVQSSSRPNLFEKATGRRRIPQFMKQILGSRPQKKPLLENELSSE